MRGRPRQPLSSSSRRSIYSRDFGLLLVPLVGVGPHGAGLAAIGVAAVGILFFIKKKAPRPKPAEKREEKAEEEKQEREDPTLEGLLSKAKFPIRSKVDLLKALGGARAMVKVDSTLVPAREIVDRCFSKTKRFESPEQVVKAFSSSSWATMVLDLVNLTPFPVYTEEPLKRSLGASFVDGVPIARLLPKLRYPVESPSDLLAQIQGARSKTPEESGAIKVQESPKAKAEEPSQPA